MALRTLEIYEERKLYDHVRAVAPRFQERLRGLGTHALVGDARGIGLLGAVELVRDKDTKAAFDAKQAIGAKCMQLCQDRGLIVRAIGDSVAICPPFIVTPGDIDDIFDRLGDGLDERHAGLGTQRTLAVKTAVLRERILLLLAAIANASGGRCPSSTSIAVGRRFASREPPFGRTSVSTSTRLRYRS